MFSDAISSISWRWRPSSPLIAAAISGSASARVAVKNESGAEAVLALVAEGLIGEISPPPQALKERCGRSGVAVESGAGGIPYRAAAAKRLRVVADIYARYGGNRGRLRVGFLVAPALSRGPIPVVIPGRCKVSDPEARDSRCAIAHLRFALRAPRNDLLFHYTNRYAPPFSTERWNAGRACMRDSQALKFGYGPSLSNTFAISPTKLIWISAPVSDFPTKNSLPFSAPST